MLLESLNIPSTVQNNAMTLCNIDLMICPQVDTQIVN